MKDWGSLYHRDRKCLLTRPKDSLRQMSYQSEMDAHIKNVLIVAAPNRQNKFGHSCLSHER